jgi:hypothetical protein
MNTTNINRLKARMDREISRCTASSIISNVIYVALKREQISQRYLRLMQAVMRRKESIKGIVNRDPKKFLNLVS